MSDSNVHNVLGAQPSGAQLLTVGSARSSCRSDGANIRHDCNKKCTTNSQVYKSVYKSESKSDINITNIKIH